MHAQKELHPLKEMQDNLLIDRERLGNIIFSEVIGVPPKRTWMRYLGYQQFNFQLYQLQMKYYGFVQDERYIHFVTEFLKG